jgi:predicted amidohydrolase
VRCRSWVGGPGHRPCDGASAVYGPDGSMLCHADPGRDTVIFADFEPDTLARVRGWLRMLAEQRAANAAGPEGPAHEVPGYEMH